MSRIFTTVIKKVISGGGGAINSTASAKPGVAVSQTSRATITPAVAGGAAVTQAAATLLVQPKPGVALTQTIAGTATPTETAGVGQVTSLNAGQIPAAAGGKIVQITYNLTQTQGALSAASTGTWASPTNAQGAHDGTFATNANTVTTAASGALTLTYAAQPNKTPLTITNVTLNRYAKYVAGLVGPGTVLVEYSLNSGSTWTTLLNTTASFDASVTPASTDLTTPVAGSWTSVAQFQLRATFTAASSATVSTYSFDAAELIVTANATQVP